MYTYKIRFTLNGHTETQVDHYKASNIASAYEKCLRKYPEAKLIKGIIEGSYQDAHGVIRRGTIVYDAPSTVRITVKPAPKEEQSTFDFLETLSSGKTAQLKDQNAKQRGN
jgi:hypothetical protein